MILLTFPWHVVPYDTHDALCVHLTYLYLSCVLQKGIPVICEGLSGVIGEAGEFKDGGIKGDIRE